ncbi:ribonuclease HI family protein [Vagococcus fluvialis]|uniref:ribonuclease HI family protein n=1 Tax=Vagococcus fluvialis TaxID=2738 RepID=UPI001A8F5340|nr:ribonuclease HI family protein [Vagococcus fluvialis]MBO0438086.1 ribonuclease HI family protein [Vagococcus fluvialis]
MIKIFIDAATNQTTNTSAGGMLFLRNGQQLQKHVSLLAETNNEAEFEMMVKTLEFLISEDFQNETIFIYTDSKIVMESLHKEYVKDSRFKMHLEIILKLSHEFPSLFIEWIEEKNNKGADNLARQALQKKYPK